MSLYGNVKKIGSATFQFDRKYNNRVEMDGAAATDGVYAGRYVLIEYGYRFGLDDSVITTTTDGTGIIENNNEFKLVNTPDGSIRAEGVVENTNYKNNANVDLRTYGAVYDSTVWQKVYINENGVPRDKYIMVAELNASAPKLDIIQDTPLEYKSMETELPRYRTEGIVTGKLNERGELIETVRLTNAKEIYNRPHFDTAIDTELTYLMHLPTTLNLELGDNTVDFNENGFNIAYSYPDSEGISAITWLPKGHDEEGNPIYLDSYAPAHIGNTDNAGNSFALLDEGTYPMDTKMLFMSFPALGNAMNALYNLIYGKPDPLDDLQHGAMRPYFKRFLSSINMKNRATVLDNANNSIFITSTNDLGEDEYVYIEGKVGKKVEAILNPFDALSLNNLQPSSYVQVRFKDENSTKPYPYNYYPLSADPNSDYGKLEKDENGIPYTEGSYVLFDTYRNEPITMTIHTPTGDEDPDLDWLKQIPALADILSNNTTGLATVLSSIFGTADPLTGTTKYYLYNDWTMSADDGSSGPAIANKPKIIGGYEQTFAAVLNGASNKNILGDKIYESPGYMWNYAEPQLVKIDYPHTEIVTSKIFSGGAYQIDFNNWQLVDYQEPNIKLIINKLIIAENATIENKTTAQANQELIRISRNGNTITFSTYMELNSYEHNGTAGKWVCFDVDTGFSSVVKLKLNNNILTDEYEDNVIHELGVKKGHLAIWLDASTIIESPASFTVSAAGFNDASFTIQYIHNNT